MRTLLAGRSHMSSSMNNKSFLWWIYFWPLINFWLFPLFFFWSPAALELLRMLLPHFSFGPVPPWKRWDRCYKMGPACHPLCTIKFLFLDYFWLLILCHLPFSFDLMPTLKRWGCCCLMGPACHPLRTINVFFSCIFLPTDFWLFLFSIPCRLWNVDSAAGSWVPDVSLPVQETCDILFCRQ